MRVLLNEQWEKFVIDHVVNPYLFQIIPHCTVERAEKLSYDKINAGIDECGNFWYEYLETCIILHPDWWDEITSRISRIYQMIDFSFFPQDKIGIRLKSTLQSRGVKEARLPHRKLTHR